MGPRWLLDLAKLPRGSTVKVSQTCDLPMLIPPHSPDCVFCLGCCVTSSIAPPPLRSPAPGLFTTSSVNTAGTPWQPAVTQTRLRGGANIFFSSFYNWLQTNQLENIFEVASNWEREKYAFEVASQLVVNVTAGVSKESEQCKVLPVLTIKTPFNSPAGKWVTLLPTQ